MLAYGGSSSSWDRKQRALHCALLAGVNISADGQPLSAKELKVCTGQIRELVLGKLNEAVAGKLAQSVKVLRDSFIGG